MTAFPPAVTYLPAFMKTYTYDKLCAYGVTARAIHAETIQGAAALVIRRSWATKKPALHRHQFVLGKGNPNTAKAVVTIYM